MRLSRISVLVSLAALAATSFTPALAHAEKPKPGTKKYLAEEAVQRIGFDGLAAIATIAAPIGMIGGSVASDIPYAPVRNWGEKVMGRSMVLGGTAEMALSLGLNGRTPADPNDVHAVVAQDWNLPADAGKLHRFATIAGGRVAAGVLGAAYTVVSPISMILGSVAAHIPATKVKSWGEDVVSQSELGVKIAQNLLAVAFAGKSVDDPLQKYPLAGYAWGWDDGRKAPTTTTTPTPAGGSGSGSTTGSQPPQRPTIGIAPGTHVSLPGANGGFHH